MENKKYYTIGGIILGAVLVFMAGRYSVSPSSGLAAVIHQDSGKPADVDFSTFWEVWNLLKSNYVDKDKLNTQDMINGAIDGLVHSTGDPYTTFFSPKESKQFQEQISGSFGGVGIELGMRDDILTVIAPIKDSPAQHAGILAGDKILKIDDKSTDGMKVEEAVTLIRGPQNTSVTLSIFTPNSSKAKDVKLTRQIIKIPAVEWKMLDGNVAHLQVLIFNQNVDAEFKKAAQEIANSKAKRIILDLRNNPGGLLDSAVDLSGYFLDPNSVVTIQRDGDGKETTYHTERNGLLKGYPVIILLNKGSASASEILAGTLKDNRNVLIVGETSYGKGSVQDIFQLPGKASIKITFAKWFTPSGISISKEGIKPNIEVLRSDEDIKGENDPQLDKALELIKGL